MISASPNTQASLKPVLTNYKILGEKKTVSVTVIPVAAHLLDACF